MGMFENVEAIFFDIDGTLVDVFPVHNQSYQIAFQKITGILKEPSFFVNLYQVGTENAVWAKALEACGQRASPRTIERLKKQRGTEFKGLVKTVSARHVLLGIVPLLNRLQRTGKRLFVFSGNTRPIGEAILRQTGLARFFEKAFFSTDSKGIANKEEMFAWTLRKAGVPAHRALAVGDTPKDLIAARHAGMKALAVATGFHSLRELKAVGCGRVVRRLHAPKKPLRRKR